MAENIQIVIDARDRASGVFRNVGSAANSSAAQITNSTGNITKGVLGAQIAFRALEFAVGIVRKGIGFFAESLQMGARFAQTEIALKTMAENMGVTTEQIDEMREALAETNTYGMDATETILTFIQTGLQGNVDLNKFVLTAKEFAAAVGVSSKEAIQDFTKAIGTLRPELLENYRIQLSLNNLYSEYAKKIGKTVTELTSQEKRELLIQEIYRQGIAVQGVYAETYKTCGKNLLSLRDAMTNIKEYIGKAFEPALAIVTNILVKLSKKVIDFFVDNKEEIAKFSDKVAKVVDDIINTMKEWIVKAINLYNKHKDEIINVIETIRKKYNELKPTIDDIVNAVKNLVKEWGDFIQIFVDFKNKYPATAKAFGDLLKLIGVVAGAGLNGALQQLNAHLTFLRLALDLVGKIMEWLMNNIIEPINQKLSLLVEKIKEALSLLGLLIGVVAGAGLNGALQQLNAHLTFLRLALDLVGKIMEWLMNNIIEPINQKLSLLVEKIKEALSLLGLLGGREGGGGGGGSFQTGGVVPGPIGIPQLAVVHGGERVSPALAGIGMNNQGGNGATLNVNVGIYAGSATEKRQLAKELYEGLVYLARARNKTVAELIGA